MKAARIAPSLGLALSGFFLLNPAASADTSAVPANVDTGEPRARGPYGRKREIVLAPDDIAAFPVPPKGFDARRDGIPHGRSEMIEYVSKAVGTRRRMLVYSPPGYSADGRYPVLYLLHGIGGDETEWQRYAPPEVILDNLIAEGRAVPMIVVMPNGRARRDDRSQGNIYSDDNIHAFEAFEADLLGDVIPSIEARYPVLADRRHRELAGFSMGAGQSLNFGLSHISMFAWIGAFSPAPNTHAPQVLVPDTKGDVRGLSLLWLSCGNHDGLIGIAQGVHRYLEANGVAHVWQVDGNAHDTPEWRASLYHFSQFLFR